MTEYRASFDAAIRFGNGGDLTAHGFRVDVPSPDTDEDAIAALFVASLGLLMTDSVTLTNVEVLAEPHKGTRGGPSDHSREGLPAGRLVELNHVIRAGMVTYPGLPGPQITPYLTREASRGHYAAGTEFAIDRLSLLGNTGTYLDAPYHRALRCEPADAGRNGRSVCRQAGVNGYRPSSSPGSYRRYRRPRAGPVVDEHVQLMLGGGRAPDTSGLLARGDRGYPSADPAPALAGCHRQVGPGRSQRGHPPGLGSCCRLGLLRIGRTDTIGPADPGPRVEPGAALASARMNMDHDPLPGDHPETGHVSTGALPPDTDVQALISVGYERYRHLGEGAVADYIPALAAASPSAFGVCVAGVGGRLFSAGDADQEFAIESISKLFVFALVCQTLGHDQARRKLGVNSTGLPFNSVMAIELNADRTMNPLVNAGAIATTSLVPGTTAEEKFESIVAAMSQFAGRRLVMDGGVYESEAATNDRNRGIAHLLDGYGRMYCDPDLATDVYTRQCSVRVSARDLAVMGATLANGGVNPVTGEQAIETRYCKRVLAVLATAGLYEQSGEWLYDVGLPGKSGVAGGIVTVSPGKGGVGTFSPPLDAAGNSVRGQHITRYLSEALGLNLFASTPFA